MPLEGAQVVHRKLQFQAGEHGGSIAVLDRLFGLALERLHLALHLRHDVAHAGQVIVHRGELVLALFLALLMLEDAGSFLDEHAQVLGLRLQDGAELALADDGMGPGPQARIVQDIQHVHAPGHGSVDQVFARAVAVHTAGKGDFGEIDRQGAVGIVQDEADFRHPLGFARRRAREDDIFHGLAAQVPGIALAQHPQHRVGDI